MKSLLLKIASLFYGFGVSVRNLLFDRGWLHIEEFDIPVICVGNITVGGTGKTPIVELLVEYLSREYNVAVISRGYGRCTKGYRVVETTDNYRTVGDEPLQIKMKFPSVPVVVCERRVDGIKQLLAEFEGIDVVIMDDGFQHRYVKPYLNIVVVDATRPPYEDNLLPYGQLRDNMGSLYRANMYVVTKCPETMNPINYRIFNQHLIMKASQSIFFSRMAERSVRSL
ncbi:MAG: tetraacyldisaccharide 4'-kinase, partial [Alistipes sp.]|nr:tetraacyldisaccharide 4'-kinase [Alistipes sp.]